MFDEFLTKDLSVAGLCYAKGVKLLEVRREGRLCWFVFQNKNRCQDLQQDYFAKAVEVNAKDYADALRTLKDLVFMRE